MNVHAVLQEMVQETVEMLSGPKAYFQRMPKEGSLAVPMARMVAWGFGWYLIELVSRVVNGSLEPAFAVKGAVLSPVAALGVLFIASFFLWIISIVCGGTARYKTSARVISSFAVLYFVVSIIQPVFGFQYHVALAAWLLLSACILWLYYNALVYGLTARPGAAKVVIGILAVLNIGVLGSMLSMQRISNKIQQALLEQNVNALAMKQTLEKLQMPQPSPQAQAVPPADEKELDDSERMAEAYRRGVPSPEEIQKITQEFKKFESEMKNQKKEGEEEEE